MKHTPAPWRADIRRDLVPSKNIRQIVIEAAPGQKACIAEVGGPFHPDMADANAHLMAAAPQMYRALLDASLALGARPLTIPHDPEELRVRADVAAAIHAANPDLMGWDEDYSEAPDDEPMPQNDFDEPYPSE